MPNRNDSVGLLVMYGSGLTDAQCIQECTDSEAFMLAMGRTVDPTHNVVIDGDSHTVYYLSKLARRMDWNLQKLGFEFLPLGASGKTLATCVTQYAGSIAIYYNHRAWYTKNTLFLWASTNDIEAGTAVATITGNLDTYVASAQATGFTIALIPTMSRNYTAAGIGALQKKLNAASVNDHIIGGLTGADYVIEFPNTVSGDSVFYTPRTNYGSDAAFQTAWDALNNNTTYFDADRVHLKDTAYSLIANQCSNYLLTL